MSAPSAEAPLEVEAGMPSGSQVRTNFANLLSRELVNKAARFAATAVLVRALTVEDFGIVNVGIAASGIALIATGFGLPELGSRQAAVSPRDAPWLAGRIVTVRLLVLGAISTVAVAVVALTSPADVSIVVLSAAMGLVMATSPEWLLRGFERMGALGWATACGGLTVLAGSIVVALTTSSPTAALAVFVLGECTAATLCWRATRGDAIPRLGLGGVRSLLKRSWPLGLSALAIYSYYANLDTLIIAATRSTAEAGLYTAAYRAFLVFNLVPIFAAYSLMPQLARAVEADREGDAQRLLRQGLRYLAAYGALTLGFAELAGKDFLGLLFGTPFASMGGVFTLLCVGVMWYAVGFPAGYTLIAREQHTRFLWGSATAAVLNVVLNVILIPPGGATGAAVATAISFAAACLVWLGAHRLLAGAWLPVGAMVLLSAGAALTRLEPSWEPAIGLASIGLGLGLALPMLVRLVSRGARSRPG